MSDTVSALRKLAGYLKAAARQRTFMEPRLADKRFISEGGQVFHAVDTDIIKLMSDPASNSVSSRGREGYAEVLPDDVRPITAALGRTLAEFIFHRLDVQRPMLVIPPMDQEIRVVYGAVRANAEAEQKKVIGEFDRLSNLANKIGSLKGSDAVDVMLKEAPTLARFFAGTEGHAAEYQRFLSLLRKNRLYLLDSSAVSAGSSIALPRAFAPLTGLRDIVGLQQLRDRWLSALHKHKSPRLTVTVFDDAHMLARIEWINQRLRNEKEGDVPARLVLISGDRAMYEAAGDYVMEGDEKDFATLYLRHPKSYLAEPWVLSPEKEDNDVETDFYRWMDTFLANALEIRGGDIPNLKQLAAMAEAEIETFIGGTQSNPTELVEDFRNKWDFYARSVMLDHGHATEEEYSDPSASARERKSDSAHHLWEKLTRSLERVETEIDEKVLETWQAFFESVTATGYVFLRESRREGGVRRSRNPPCLTFDRFNLANRLSQRILNEYNSAHLNTYYREIEKLKDEGQDKSAYTYFLVFSQLFAAEGAWSAAGILAHRALGIADRNAQLPITGREAAYMYAVCRRHSATSADELKGLGEFLDRAERNLEVDKRDYPSLTVGKSRFQSERAALGLTGYLFNRFLDQSLPGEAPSLDDIEGHIRTLLAELDDNEMNVAARSQTQRHLLTNLLMIGLLRINGKEDVQKLTEMRPYLVRLKECVQDENLRTFLISVVGSVTECLLEPNASERNAMKRRIRKILLSEDSIEKFKVMPYDEGRFKYMLRLLEL